MLLSLLARQRTSLACGLRTGFSTASTEKSFAQLMKERSALFPLYTHYYKELFVPASAQGEFVFDRQGRKYIDLIGGISCVNIGHSHPRLTEIYHQESQRLLNLSSHYVHQYQGEYAEKLCSWLGGGLDTTFFFSSGSEANDFAVNLARAYTRSNVVLALRNAYHGTAGQSYQLTNLLTWNTSLPKQLQLERLTWPNPYRSPIADYDAMLLDAEQQLDSGTNGKVAGLWLEPIMGAGGIVPLPPHYVQRLYALVKRYGGLYISDEVQSGFCRVGKEEWGFKWQGVTPDIVVMAKAIANGQALSAVVTRREIADALNHDYFPSSTAGPLECRLASEVADILREEKYGEKSDDIGGYLMGEFKRIQKKCKHIGDVRGKGMMIGVEIVKDPITKEPDLELLSHIFEKGREAGVLFGKGGHKGHLIRVLGPLCLSRQSAQTAIGVFEEIIDGLPK